MTLDKPLVQSWVAGAELQVEKEHQPFAKVPLVSQIKIIADQRRKYTLTERIDLTRAKNFRVQNTSEDFLFASVELPVLGKRGVGSDTGLAVASFDYTDREDTEHSLIAICAYTVSGVVGKKRELKKVIVLPMA
jgi:hypothetical protein